MSRKIKTRGKSPTAEQPYPINEFPNEVIHDLGKRIVYLMAMGRQDMSGDEFDQMYADVVDAKALSSPLGVVDAPTSATPTTSCRARPRPTAPATPLNPIRT